MQFAEYLEPDSGVNGKRPSLRSGLQPTGNLSSDGLGESSIRRRRARMARNPRTGAPVAVPVKIIPYFTPSAEIKRRLAG